MLFPKSCPSGACLRRSDWGLDLASSLEHCLQVKFPVVNHWIICCSTSASLSISAQGFFFTISRFPPFCCSSSCVLKLLVAVTHFQQVIEKDAHWCSTCISMKRKNSSFRLIDRERGSIEVEMENISCEWVNSGCHTGRGRDWRVLLGGLAATVIHCVSWGSFGSDGLAVVTSVISNVRRCVRCWFCLKNVWIWLVAVVDSPELVSSSAT